MTKEELLNKIYSKKYIIKFKKRIKLLGTSNKIDPYNILLLRLITSVLLFIVLIFTMKYGYLIGPIIVIMYHMIYDYVLINSKLKRRTYEIENEAMHFFEVLTLSLETGRNLIEAIEVTTSNVSGLLSQEFKETLRETKLGKSLNESLKDMEERIPSDTVCNIILSLTQANIYGNSIVDNLYDEVNFLRDKRRLLVKSKISKVPVYISIISVFFFIPLILLIILGPILLDFLKQ